MENRPGSKPQKGVEEGVWRSSEGDGSGPELTLQTTPLFVCACGEPFPQHVLPMRLLSLGGVENSPPSGGKAHR